MPTHSTTFPTRQEGLAQRSWVVVDGEGRALGRLATQVADLLRGKGKPTFSPHVDCGDFVIVVNASKVRLTGAKADEKLYYRHSEYPGGLRTATAGELRSNESERLIREAVKGMLPKNRLSRRLITKLKVYPDAQHPHGAQKASAVEARD
ncbi:MAG: 50S ribosomal protein L13 [Deltaproteobacteria bacterium]|nr:50S ribosomal protein L13 [Deltaproteobacteria bacterium]